MSNSNSLAMQSNQLPQPSFMGFDTATGSYDSITIGQPAQSIGYAEWLMSQIPNGSQLCARCRSYYPYGSICSCYAEQVVITAAMINKSIKKLNKVLLLLS